MQANRFELFFHLPENVLDIADQALNEHVS